MLKENEKERFESEVESALTFLNVVFDTTPRMNLKTKLAFLKQAIEGSKNCDKDWADFNGEIDKYV